jgi:hypothetical protein
LMMTPENITFPMQKSKGVTRSLQRARAGTSLWQLAREDGVSHEAIRQGLTRAREEGRFEDTQRLHAVDKRDRAGEAG